MILPEIRTDTSILPEIRTDTSILPGIKSDTSILPGIKSDTSILPEINGGINNLNIKFDAFSSRLERILEKLVDR